MFGLAIGAAITTNVLSLMLWKGQVLPELDGIQVLIRVSLPVAAIGFAGVF